ncbi:deoxyhypusine synthase, partial [Candidatus Nomurabacteria bacterium]|nr:deoxyhypusine synthase [Candidatus Nomurabacteria bacterium]
MKINTKDKHVQYAVKECITLEGHPQINGYDFEQPFNFQDFLKAYALTGFQATH